MFKKNIKLRMIIYIDYFFLKKIYKNNQLLVSVIGSIIDI